MVATWSRQPRQQRGNFFKKNLDRIQTCFQVTSSGSGPPPPGDPVVHIIHSADHSATVPAELRRVDGVGGRLTRGPARIDVELAERADRYPVGRSRVRLSEIASQAN
jgi:hypothetical protein